MSLADSLMSLSDRAFNTTERILQKPIYIFSNSYIKHITLVLLALYAPIAAPTLHHGIVALLQNYIVKLIYIFIFTYLLSGSIRVSLVTSVVIVLGMFILKKFNVTESFSISDILPSRQQQVIPTEPVIDRQELTKSLCGVVGNVESNPLDNITENNAMANHEDALHPQQLEDMKEVDINNSVGGYDNQKYAEVPQF